MYALIEVTVYSCCNAPTYKHRIHTGWSTVAAKQPHLEEHHLPPEELNVIKDVLQRAEAMEKMEEIRVGYV